MTWNYRVIRENHIHNNTHTTSYQIYEVYYDDDSMAVQTWSAKPLGPMGESLEELRDDLQLFLKAFHKPILKKEFDGESEILILDEEIPNNFNKPIESRLSKLEKEWGDFKTELEELGEEYQSFKAKKFDKKFESGEDLANDLDFSKSRRLNQKPNIG